MHNMIAGQPALSTQTLDRCFGGSLFRRALTIYEKALGPDHPTVGHRSATWPGGPGFKPLVLISHVCFGFAAYRAEQDPAECAGLCLAPGIEFALA
jgi:hypothetical protein